LAGPRHRNLTHKRQCHCLWRLFWMMIPVKKIPRLRSVRIVELISALLILHRIEQHRARDRKNPASNVLFRTDPDTFKFYGIVVDVIEFKSIWVLSNRAMVLTRARTTTTTSCIAPRCQGMGLQNRTSCYRPCAGTHRPHIFCEL
jgi:hypothetical protein